jgi:hypothetical protein
MYNSNMHGERIKMVKNDVCVNEFGQFSYPDNIDIIIFYHKLCLAMTVISVYIRTT